MKNLLLSVLLVLAAGAAAWGVAYRRCCDPALHAAAQAGDAAAWLKAEFRLNDAQMARITELQDEYSEQCSVHCARIVEARKALASLRKSGADDARIAAARQLVTDREALCRDAIRDHLRRVAALMPPEQGKRYLDMLLPKVDAFQHRGAPNLRLDP